MDVTPNHVGKGVASGADYIIPFCETKTLVSLNARGRLVMVVRLTAFGLEFILQMDTGYCPIVVTTGRAIQARTAPVC